MASVACIDPGKSGTGVAVWTRQAWELGEVEPYLIESIRVRNYVAGCKALDDIFSAYKVKQVYIERSGFYSGSEVGRITAATQDLITLTEFIGVICGMCIMRGIGVELIPAIIWKGTVPKHITQERIEKIFPGAKVRCKTSHAFDAVGIGLYLLRKIKNETVNDPNWKTLARKNPARYVVLSA